MRAYELILRSGTPGRIYPIGSGRLRTLGEVAARFEELASVPIRWRIGPEADTPPVSLAQPSVLDLGRPDAPPPGPAAASPVDMAPMRSLGWRPVLPFSRSAEEILAYFRKEADSDEEERRG
ncbi:hypothetical protein LJK88_11690 [Paenibacillus sp. P26]|nr:hypothetical protein LJK88_11690 [Paenibacillus sp. P26]